MNKKSLTEAVGKTRGRMSNKANRAAKLIERWQQIEDKMIGFIIRGAGNTEMARLAYGVLLMMETGIRVGNEASAEGWVCVNQIVARRSNKAKGIRKGDIVWRHPQYGQHVQTFGLTTLQNRHVRKRAGKLYVNFVGKKLVEHKLVVTHKTLVGYYPPTSGGPTDKFLEIDYPGIKRFVSKYVGRGFTPKDLRTAKVNIMFIDKFAACYAKEYVTETTKGGRKRLLAEAIEETALQVGHTKGVCRSAYITAPLLETISNS